MLGRLTRRLHFGQSAITRQTLGEEGDCGVGRKAAAVDEQIGFRGTARPRPTRQADDGNALFDSELEAALCTILKDTPVITDADESDNGLGFLQLGELKQHAQLSGSIAGSVAG
jgi:hypothetical protein